MAPADLEAGVLLSCEPKPEEEASPTRRSGAVLRVLIGAGVACSMLGLLAWSYSDGTPDSKDPTQALAYMYNSPGMYRRGGYGYGRYGGYGGGGYGYGGGMYSMRPSDRVRESYYGYYPEDDDYYGGGKSYGGKSNWGGNSYGYPSGNFKIDKSGGELGEFVGQIKSFNPKTNYGFITCPDLAEHGDVFLHGDMKKGYQEGQTVKFTAVLNKNGKPVAISLKSGLKSSGGSTSSSGKGGFTIDKSGGELGEFVGKIKSFNWNTNYGFITCDDLADHGDVFLHGDMIKGYQQGHKVKFTAVLNKDGKPVAIDLKSGLK